MFSPFPGLQGSQSQLQVGYGAGMSVFLFESRVKIVLLTLWCLCVSPECVKCIIPVSTPSNIFLNPFCSTMPFSYSDEGWNFSTPEQDTVIVLAMGVLMLFIKLMLQDATKITAVLDDNQQLFNHRQNTLSWSTWQLSMTAPKNPLSGGFVNVESSRVLIITTLICFVNVFIQRRALGMFSLHFHYPFIFVMWPCSMAELHFFSFWKWGRSVGDSSQWPRRMQRSYHCVCKGNNGNYTVCPLYYIPSPFTMRTNEVTNEMKFHRHSFSNGLTFIELRAQS